MISIEENTQKATALIKFFSEEEHYLSFRNGCSLLRTPHYFRRCEVVGRGDRHESCLGYWDKDLGDKVPSLVIDGKKIENDIVKSLFIYQAHEQQDSWLQSWCVIGPHNNFEESLERMLEEFGKYFVIMPVEYIKNYAGLLSQVSGDEVRYGFIRYSNNPLDRSLTVKDSKFSYQREFRFYLGYCKKDETQDRKLNLKSIGKLLFEANSLRFESPNGQVRYCSIGRKAVIKTTLSL